MQTLDCLVDSFEDSKKNGCPINTVNMQIYVFVFFIVCTFAICLLVVVFVWFLVVIVVLFVAAVILEIFVQLSPHHPHFACLWFLSPTNNHKFQKINASSDVVI